MVDVPNLSKNAWPLFITEALGIPHVDGSDGPWHSSGDTTDVAWFFALCAYLDINYEGERIRAMRKILEAAGGTWDEERHSSGRASAPGGNVKKAGFEDLWLALRRSGYIGEDGTPGNRPAPAVRTGVGPVPELEWTYRNILRRRGQQAFRARLLVAYGGRCAVSGADVADALEAAHIRPHAIRGTMDTSNGILLRADLHTLFDLRRIAVDTSAWSVLVHPSIRSTSLGGELHGRLLELPRAAADWPSKDALDEHRQRSGVDAGRGA